jgi:hypothetical protein
VDAAVAAGFRPPGTRTANRDEWEHFESGYALDWEDWLMRHGDHPEAGRVRPAPTSTAPAGCAATATCSASPTSPSASRRPA